MQEAFIAKLQNFGGSPQIRTYRTNCLTGTFYEGNEKWPNGPAVVSFPGVGVAIGLGFTVSGTVHGAGELEKSERTKTVRIPTASGRSISGLRTFLYRTRSTLLSVVRSRRADQLRETLIFLVSIVHPEIVKTFHVMIFQA
jgi:hypothetical protein